MKPSHCLKRISLTPSTVPSNPWTSSPWAGQSTLHRTGRSAIAVREFEPGEFEWRAEHEHSGCVLSGSAVLYLADGRRVNLQPGTSFYLPQGMHGRWSVEQRLRTVVVEQSPDGPPKAQNR